MFNVGAKTQCRTNGTKVTVLNARSSKTVNKKLNKLKNVAFSTDSDIVEITKTWLAENL